MTKNGKNRKKMNEIKKIDCENSVRKMDETTFSTESSRPSGTEILPEECQRIFTIFNPDEQERFGVHPERCVIGTAPTLQTIVREYGEKAALRWLYGQILEYNRWVGVREKNKICDGTVIKKLAILMLGEHQNYKLTDVMLFFCKLKKGDYEKMYGFVDATKIMSAYKSFDKDRQKIKWAALNAPEPVLTPEERHQKEYDRLVGLVRYFESNPKSYCQTQLKSYYESGYLAEYGIHIDPVIFNRN